MTIRISFSDKTVRVAVEINGAIESAITELPPCPTCEALARTVMLDQTSHDAQRKPLSDEQMKKIWYAMQNIMGWYSFEEVARAIEAAHGIKE